MEEMAFLIEFRGGDGAGGRGAASVAPASAAAAASLLQEERRLGDGDCIPCTQDCSDQHFQRPDGPSITRKGDAVMKAIAWPLHTAAQIGTTRIHNLRSRAEDVLRRVQHPCHDIASAAVMA